jgi:hypothetical protein
LFYVPLQNARRHHHCQWRAAKFTVGLGYDPLSWKGFSLCHTCCDMGPGRDLYRTTPVLTRDLGIYCNLDEIFLVPHLFWHRTLVYLVTWMESFLSHTCCDTGPWYILWPVTCMESLSCHICCDTGPWYISCDLSPVWNLCRATPAVTQELGICCDMALPKRPPSHRIMSGGADRRGPILFQIPTRSSI